jgi:AcrR family transcriptional regulator
MKTTKDEIVLEAIKLFMTKGYDAASTAEIAAAVGLKNSSCLFSHFATKAEIYRSALEKYVVNVQTPEQKFGDCSQFSLSEFIDHYLQKVSETMAFLRAEIVGEATTPINYLSFLLDSAKRDDDFAQAMLEFDRKEMELWTEVIGRAQQSGEVRQDLDTPIIAMQFRYAFVGMSYLFSVRGGVTVDELRSVFDGVYNSIKSNHN